MNIGGALLAIKRDKNIQEQKKGTKDLFSQGRVGGEKIMFVEG